MSNALQAYLPACILDFLKEASAEGLNLDPPLSDSFSTVVLFADVSGYTKLCEAISMSGVSKPDEQLAKALTTYFEQLLRTLTKQGADVLKFAGDALLCVWPKSASGDLGELCRRAAQAAIEVKDSLNDFALDSEACGGATLSVKIGIGVGPITLLHVGGVYRRLEYLAVGTPLQQAFSSEGLASPGDVIVSPQVWDLISEHFTSSRLEQGYAFLQTCEGKLRKASVKTARSNPYDLMTRYIPSAVVPFVELDEEIWASELRRVTVLFVNLDLGPHLISITEQREVDAVQEVISSVQSAVYRFQGSLNKFLVDDKGSTLIAVFGLPPLAHEDDAIRGVLASLAICTRLHEMGLYPSIGVTTGVAFAGLVGSSSRHEYTVLGDTVNLSARLMQRATKQGGGILVEKTTQYACRDRILFAKLGKIKVKGKKAQISIYQPYSQDLEPVYRGLRDGGSDRRAGFLDRDVHSAEPSPDAVESAKMLQLQLDGYAKQHFLSLQKSRGVQPLSARDSLIGDALSTQASGGADMPIKAARIALPTDEARLTMPCVNIGTVGELAEATFARLKSRKMLPKGAQAPEEFTFLFAGTNIRLQNDLPLTDLASLMAANNIAIAPVVDLTLLHNSSSQETVNHLVDIHTQLRDCVQRLIQDKEGGVVIIEGEQGYGKSRLLSATVCEAPPYLSLFCGVGNPFELDRPLSVWCDLISQLPLVRLADKMRADEHPMAPYLGLLTEYLTEADTRGMHLDPATPEIGEIGDDSRARETYACNVMIALMQFSCERQSAIVVIDDAVFLDPLSWTLSLRMSREVQGLLLVLSTRPMNYSNMAAFSTKIPPEYEVIVADERTLSISLKPLPDDIIYQMACECLGHNLVPPMLAALILEKSHGNPLVVTEFIYALREEGIIVDGVDTVELRADLQYYDYARLMAEVNVPVPLTLQALLGCRLDRLSHTQRMLLKVMAVAGPSARSDVVYESWPNSRKSPEDFEQAFAELEAMSVITRLPTKPKKELDSTSIQYKFVNGFMRDMILSRMLAEQHGRLKDIIDRVSRARLERLASDCAFKLTDRKIIKGYMNVSVYTAAEWEERLARANEAAASAKKKKKRRWSKNKDAPKPEPVHRESRLYCLLSAYGTLSGWIDEEAYWTAASSRFPSPSVVVQHPVLLVNLDSSTMGNRSSTSFSVRVNDPMHDGVAKSGEYVVEMRMPEGHEMDSQSSTVHITKWATKVREAVQEQLSPEKQHMLELLRKTRKWKQERLRVGLKKGSIQLDIRQPLALTEGEKRLLQGQFIRSVIEVENKRRLRGILNQQVRVRKSSSSLFASNWKRRWMTLTESCLFFRRTELPQFAALQRQDSDKALNTPTSKPARSNSRFARSDLAKKKTSHTDVVALNTGTLVCELGGYDKSANVYTLIIKCDLWLKRLEPNWISRPFTIGVDTLSEAKKWEAAINAVILEHKKAILATRTRAAKAALTGAGGGTSSAASTESAPGSAAVASLAASRGGSAPATQVDDDFVPQTRMQHSISITEGAIKPSEFYTSGGAAPSSHNSSSTFPLPSKAPGQRDSASAGPASPNGHDASKRPPFMRGSSNVAREIAMRPYRVDSDGLLDSVMSAMRELAMTEVDFAQDHMGFEDIQGVIEEEPDDFGDDDDDAAAASSSGTMSKIVRAKLREFAQRIKSQVKTSRVIHGGIDNKQPTTKSEGDFVQLVNSADLDGNSKAWLERTFTRETGIGPNGTRHGRTRSRSSLVVVGIGGNEVEVSTEPAEELEEDRRRSVSLDSGTSSGTGDRDPLEPLVPGDDGADEENDEDDAESGADADADADDAAASSEPDADGSPSSAESSPTSAQKKPKLERSNSLSTKPVESTTAAELVALAHVADSFQKTYRRLGKEEREQNAALVLRTVRDPSLPEDLEGFADWSWDVLSYTPEQLVASVVLMFREAGYLDLFQIDHTVFANFLGMVRANYLENPFHNFYHGVDVCQSIYCFLHQFGALSVLDSINGFALMVAGLCHDVGHPALNNAYHIAARTPLVLVYGDDSSVLEQHHCATTFRILATPETNILKNLTAGQYRTVQSGIVDCIMATDMTCHFLLVEEFNTVVERWMQSKSRMSPEDQKVAMRVVLHCADISNPCKSWKLSKAWSDYIGEEFFVQGDLERERGLPISPNCDRETTDQAKLGVNFIDFIVAPLYVALRQMLPRTERCCQNLRENRLNWERLVMQGIDENESFTQEEKDAERERWLRRSTSFKQILTPLLTQTRERGLFRRTSMAILTEYIGANSTHDLVAAEEQDNANNDS